MGIIVMAVKGQSVRTEAQQNQVPPKLRGFLQEDAIRVSKIRRFNPDNETFRRGWEIVADSIMLTSLPDGFEMGIVSNKDDGVYVQIREDF